MHVLADAGVRRLRNKARVNRSESSRSCVWKDLSLMEVEKNATETEKKSLVDSQDGELSSVGRCRKSRSFKLALVILCIVLIAAIVVVTVILLITFIAPSGHPRRVLTLDDVFNSSFQQKSYNGTWTPENKLLHLSSQDGLTLHDPSVLTTETLIDPEHLQNLSVKLGGISDAKLSYDNQYIMLIARKEKVYRHSYVADYYLYNLQDGTVTNVSLLVNVSTTARIQFAEWSPAANIIAYVLDYNVYLFTVATNTTTTVTTDGHKNGISYGIPDWVYEEEVLSTNYALWWSHDGSKILYGSFDDTQVKDFRFPFYGSRFNQYTDIISIAYPKTGTPNPVVGLHVVSVDDVTSVTDLHPPSNIDSANNYFVYAGWASSSTPYVTWMNRTQTSAVYCIYTLPSTQCEQVYLQTSAAWIELTGGPKFFDGGTKFITLVSQAVGDDSFTHIVEVETSTGTSHFLTRGNWDVTSILGTNGSDILFISTKSSPRNRHVYSTTFGECLTCSQQQWDTPESTNPDLPSNCSYFEASCSDSLEFCVLKCKGPTLPYSLLVQYTEGMFIPVEYLENNTILNEAISEIALPTVETFQVPISGDEPALNGKATLPPFFDNGKNYPVLVYVYGGPNFQVVDSQFVLNDLGRMYLVSNLSVVLASVDGRGSGFQGDNFKHAVYKNLGHFETIDQIRGGRYLQGLPYIDGSKLAIYGSSYGGYMGAMVGSSASGVYKAAISQAPVTDWRYYDSIYTERYMGLPTDEGNTYEVSSVLPRAGNLSSVDFLLIHGTADDNVHFQQAAQLIEALVNQNVQFGLQVYTDKDHALSGDATRRHLYELLADFLRNSFQLENE